MEELIAKRYIKAIRESSDSDTMQEMAVVFSALAELFNDVKFVNIMDNPEISKDEKLEILLAAVKSVNSEKINNFIKILVENKRIDIIPALAEGMRKNIADTTKTYGGVVYSNTDVDSKTIQDLSSGLSKRFDSAITLDFIKNDFDGIKVDVEDLGVEINFSKSRINSQIIEHIIKAI